MPKLLFLLIFLIVSIFLNACAGNHFTKTGLNTPKLPPLEANQEVIILRTFPTDRQYVEIGICDATAPGGGIMYDNSGEALEELKKCARKNGANAIVLGSKSEYASHFGYAQQAIKENGVAIYIYP